MAAINRRKVSESSLLDVFKGWRPEIDFHISSKTFNTWLKGCMRQCAIHSGQHHTPST